MEAKRAHQLTFGWDIEAHRDRDQVIAGVCLPRSATVADGSVSKSTLLMLLYRLNHHAWGDRECFPSVETLAREMGVDRKTVTRAAEAASQLHLLTVTKKKTRHSRLVCNHYAIDWETLQRLMQHRPHPEAVVQDAVRPPERGDILTPRPAERRDMPPGASGHCDPSEATQCPERRDSLTPYQMVGGGKTKTPSPNAQLGPGGDGVLDFRWGRRIDPAELLQPEAIDGLYEVAVLQGAARRSTADRLAFFALVAHVARTGERDKRVGLLTSLLAGRVPDLLTKSRDWRDRPNNCDDDQARIWIARADRDGEPEEPPEPAAVDRGPTREQQVAALLSRMTPTERREREQCR